MMRLNDEQWRQAVQRMRVGTTWDQSCATGKVRDAAVMEGRTFKLAYRDDDLAQEAADTITHRLHSSATMRDEIVNAGYPRRLMRTVIFNAMIDLWRRQHRAWCEHFSTLTEIQASRLMDRSDFEATIDAADAIRSFWGELRDDEKNLLRLRFWEQLSIEEIAKVLGVSYSTVAQQLHRLRAKLASRNDI